MFIYINFKHTLTLLSQKAFKITNSGYSNFLAEGDTAALFYHTTQKVMGRSRLKAGENFQEKGVKGASSTNIYCPSELQNHQFISQVSPHFNSGSLGVLLCIIIYNFITQVNFKKKRFTACQSASWSIKSTKTFPFS